MLHRRLVVSALFVVVAAGCPAPQPPLPLELPKGLALDQLSEAQRKLLRATIEVDGGGVGETDVVIDADDLSLSGDVALNNVGEDGDRTATLRIYGRNDKDAAEVLLGEVADTVEVAKNGAAFIDFAGVEFDACDADVAGACSLVFDENRNGRKNIDDLIAGVDAAPQAPFLLTSPDTLQFPSGIRTGAFARQVVVVENSGDHPIRLTQVQVAGGQGVGVSAFDPNSPVVAAPRRVLDEAALDVDADGVSDFVVQPGDEAFVAVSFAPVNGFLTTAALQISAVDAITDVPQAARTKVIANADGALRPRDPSYVEPDLAKVSLGAGDVVARSFPATQLFSGAELSSFDSEDDPGLARSGGALVVGDVAMAADGAFVVDVDAGARFAAAVAGLQSDIDVALVSLDDAGAVTGVLQTSRQAGTSAEAVEMVNTTTEPLRVAVVLGRVEKDAPAALKGALSADVRAPFRLTCQQTSGPELDDVDPVVPARGALGGGVPVVLHGRGFFVPTNPAAGPHVRITFNGQPAFGTPTIVTDALGAQTITTLLPPGIAAAADVPSTVVVENPASGDGETAPGRGADGQAATLPDGFRYDLPTPRINSITPDTATVDGGAFDVVISGAFFFDTYGDPVVVFDGEAVPAVVVDAATLLVQPPAHGAGLATVVVQNIVSNGDEGEPSNVLPFFYVVPSLPAPTVAGLDVDEGSADGGATVVVSGGNFAAGARVFFGAAEAVVSAVTATTITLTTPRAAAAGVVDVLVQNTDGQVARLTGAFTYILPPPTVARVFPDRAIVAGGATVVVTGAGFRADSAVRFVAGASDVVAASVAFSNGNTLVVTTPPFAAAGPATLVVENADGQDASIDFAFFEPQGPAPRIVALDPQSGDVDGGDNVVILGSDLDDPTVIFGSTVVGGLVVEDAANGLQQVRVRTPPGAAGAALVTLVNADGQADASSFLYVDLGEPRLIAISPSTVHARIPGDEVLVFGERLSLLGQVSARAVVAGGARVPLALTAFGDTLARLVITDPLPPGRFTVELAGSNGAVVVSPSAEAREPSVVRVEVNGDKVLMIGDNFAGDRLDAVSLNGVACTDFVADERLLTCELVAPLQPTIPVVELTYDGTVITDAIFLFAIVDGGGPRGDPRCDDPDADVESSCGAGGNFFSCSASGESVTWLQAHCACQAEGAELPVLHSGGDNEVAALAAGQLGVWIGLEDPDSTGAYDVWVDGTDVDFDQLERGNLLSGGCVQLQQSGEWVVRDCEAPFASSFFLCQAPGNGTAAELISANTPEWNSDLVISGQNLGGVEAVEMSWRADIEFVSFTLPVSNTTTTSLTVSTASLAPGPWRACVGASCVDVIVGTVNSEQEPNDQVVQATGLGVGKSIAGSGNSGDDFFFFRALAPGPITIRMDTNLQQSGCGSAGIRLDNGPESLNIDCAAAIIETNISDFANHVIRVKGEESFTYDLVVTAGGVVGEGEGEDEGFAIFVDGSVGDVSGDGDCSFAEAARAVLGAEVDCPKNSTGPQTPAALVLSNAVTLTSAVNVFPPLNNTLQIAGSAVSFTLGTGAALGIFGDVSVAGVNFFGGDAPIVANGAVSFAGCAVTNNIAGGVRVVNGNVIFDNTRFETNSSNDANFGGALTVLPGARATVLNGTSFVGNDTIGSGGAIRVVADGGLFLDDVGFIGNHANAQGGAIHVAEAGNDVVANDVNFIDNETEGDGGDAFFGRRAVVTGMRSSGAFADSVGGSIVASGPGGFVCDRCVIDDAIAGIFGGGLFAGAGTTRLRNSGIERSDGGIGGGGVFVGGSATLELEQSAIVNNNSGSGAGGIHSADGLVRLKNSIVASNTGPENDCVGGAWQASGKNLVGISGDCTVGAGAGTVVVGLNAGFSRRPGNPAQLTSTALRDPRLPLTDCLGLDDIPIIDDVNEAGRPATDCALGPVERSSIETNINVITVDNVCTLDDAVDSANNNFASAGCRTGAPAPVVDVIRFDDHESPIQLANPLVLTDDVIIDGFDGGQKNLRIEAGDGAAIFVVSGSANVVLDGLDLSGGNLDGLVTVPGSGDLRIERSHLHSSTAVGAAFGLVNGGSGHTAVVSSTMSDADAGIGAPGPILISRSTITEINGEVAIGVGRALTIEHSTLVSDSLIDALATSRVTVLKSIFASDGNFCVSGAGLFTSDGISLITGTCAPLNGIAVPDPRLDSGLAQNGGPTPTLRPSSSSPANALAVCSGDEIDQRGAAIANGVCSVGAVEFREDGTCGDGFIDEAKDAFVVADVRTVAPGSIAGIAVGDTDENGRPELLVLHAPPSAVALVDFTGGATDLFNVNPGSDLIAVGDIDGDARDDVVVGATGSVQLSVFRNLGGGSFSPGSVELSTAMRAIALLPFRNNDAKKDLVVADNNGVVTLQNNSLGIGSINFGIPQRVHSTQTNALVVVSADTDGLLDLLIAEGNNARFLFNGGAGAPVVGPDLNVNPNGSKAIGLIEGATRIVVAGGSGVSTRPLDGDGAPVGDVTNFAASLLPSSVTMFGEGVLLSDGGSGSQILRGATSADLRPLDPSLSIAGTGVLFSDGGEPFVGGASTTSGPLIKAALEPSEQCDVGDTFSTDQCNGNCTLVGNG